MATTALSAFKRLEAGGEEEAAATGDAAAFGAEEGSNFRFVVLASDVSEEEAEGAVAGAGGSAAPLFAGGGDGEKAE